MRRISLIIFFLGPLSSSHVFCLPKSLEVLMEEVSSVRDMKEILNENTKEQFIVLSESMLFRTFLNHAPVLNERLEANEKVFAKLDYVLQEHRKKLSPFSIYWIDQLKIDLWNQVHSKRKVKRKLITKWVTFYIQKTPQEINLYIRQICLKTESKIRGAWNVFKKIGS